MINVTVNTITLLHLRYEGYWLDFDCSKTTLRNRENTPLFEIIYDQTKCENILLTRENVYYTENSCINIACNEKGEPILYFTIKDNGKFKDVTINIDYDGHEEKR